MRRLRLAQPATRKRVLELVVAGPVGRWFIRHGWGAFTVPLPWVVVITYWASSPDADLYPAIRLHEFQHVFQDERNPFWLVSWAKYVAATLRRINWRRVVRAPGATMEAAYRANKYEQEAYAVEIEAAITGVYPEWCQ